MSGTRPVRQLAVLSASLVLAVAGVGGAWAAGWLPRDWTDGIQNKLSSLTGGRVPAVNEPPLYVKASPEEAPTAPATAATIADDAESTQAPEEGAELLTQTEPELDATGGLRPTPAVTAMNGEPSAEPTEFEPATPLVFGQQVDAPTEGKSKSPPPMPKRLPEQAQPAADLLLNPEDDVPVIDEPEPPPSPRKPTPVPRRAPMRGEKELTEEPKVELKRVPEPMPEQVQLEPKPLSKQPASAPTARPASSGLEKVPAPIAEIEDPQSRAKPLRGFVEIEQLIQQGDLPTALAEYSRWYWRLPEQRAELQPKLDQLAEQVFFSPRPHFHQPHVVQPGDQLRSIARKYNLPWEYLARLNKVDARKIRGGQKLKVVDGPFSAYICLTNYELIVHQRGVYVRRYRVGTGKDGSTPQGDFVVKEKLVDPTYYGDDGVIAHDNPKNPLGERWIDIGDSYGIHGTIDPASIGRNESRGCIRLLNEDVAELYDLLSIGSKVTIQK